MAWTKKSLGNVCTILDNKRKPITKHQRVSGIYPYYGATGIVDYVNDFIFDERLVLVGEDGAKWKSGDRTAFIVEGKVWVNNHAHVLQPTSNLIDSFLIYFLNHQDLTDYITGLTVPKLNQEKLRSIPIPIPPLLEQQAIVEKLDFAFDAIEKAKANIEKNIENAKELFQSKLNEIFSQKGEGWEEKKLKEMGKVQTGTTPKTAESDNYGDFIPFIKPADFKKDGSIVSKGSSLSEKGLRSGRLIDENSALMVCIGATIGKTGYTLMPVTCNQQINAITPTKCFNYKFIYYGLISNDFITKVLSEGKGAQATLPIINKSKWENLTMNVTSDLIKQDQIVSQLDLLSNQTKLLQEKYKNKLANLEELKKSILEKAFKGELV